MRKSLLFFLVLCLNTYAVFSQGFKVTGQVLASSNNEAIIGASVIVKGTTKGTVTDINGNYSLNVPSKDAILVFSYLGYKGIEENVSGRSVINVKLEENVVDLNEIVVVGYGTAKKSDISGSVASVSTEDMLKKVLPTFYKVYKDRLPV
jgi:hypothetical protein